MTPVTQPMAPAVGLNEEPTDSHRVNFPHGLPGFAECRSFLIFAAQRADFQWLASVEGPAASFLVIDPRRVEPTLRYELSPQDLVRLQATPDTPLLWLAIVLIEGDGTVSVNLRAPIVINPTTMVGYQIMPQRSLFPIRHIISAPAV